MLLLYGYQAVGFSDPYFYINEQQGESINVFNRDDFTLKRKIPSIKGPAGIAISVHNPWFAVTHPDEGIVSFIDSERLIPLELVNVGGAPFGAVFANRLLFYSDWGRDFVGVIDPKTARLIKKIPVGKSPAGLATVACESQVWVVNRESDSVSIIDPHNFSLIKNIAVGRAPFALDMDDRYAYVANSQSNTLSIIDLLSLTELKQIEVGRMPYGVAVNRKQHKVYVTNQLENTVSVIDSRSHKIINTLKTGEYPENIAVDVNSQKLYVLNWFDGTLRNAHGITSLTGAGFLFVFKAYQQAHSKLRNCWYNAEDGQKDKRVVEVISCTFLSVFDSETDKEINRINVGDGSRSFGQFVAKAVECPAHKH